MNLPETAGTDPIVAWKRAAIVFSYGEYTFMGYGNTRYKSTTAHATCESPFRRYGVGLHSSEPDVHPSGRHVPHPPCSCGWYGLSEKPADLNGYLEVELFGRVIVCENGYRAEKQRVRRVHLTRRCQFCLDDCKHFELVGIHRPPSAESGRPTPNGLTFRCDAHLRRGEFDVVVPLDHLPELLDVEVVWL